MNENKRCFTFTQPGVTVQRRHSELSPRDIEKKGVNNSHHHRSHVDIANACHHSTDSPSVSKTKHHGSGSPLTTNNLREGFVTEQNHKNQSQKQPQQQRARNNSVSSLEYSSCEYTSDSYYTSEDELDFGEIIEGDRMDDVLKEHQESIANGGSRESSRYVTCAINNN